jgi:hypothetical protein
MRFEIPFLSGRSGHSEGYVGDQGQLITDLLHGKYYHATKGGRLFSQAATPLGLAIPIYTGTALAGAMPLWNPIGSGVKAILVSVAFPWVSGTAAFGAFGLMARNGMGSVIGTGQQCTAFAETKPIGGNLGVVNAIGGQGGDAGSRVKSSNAGTVTVTAGVAAEWVRSLANQNLEAQTGTAHQTLFGVYDFDGSVVVHPGTMVWLAGTKASVALYASSLVWEEVDVNQ